MFPEKNTLTSAPAALAAFAATAMMAAAAALAGCSAAPVKMECSEIRTRLAYEDMSADQKRFAEDELADCENRVREAEARDSARIEGINDRFTPADSEAAP